MTPNERLDYERARMFEEALGVPWLEPADVELEQPSGLVPPPEPPTVRDVSSDRGRRC